MSSERAVTRGLAGLATLLALSSGCQRQVEPPPEPAKIATVEVAPPPDATLSTAGDRQETRRESTFAGVLPTGFPKDLPVYEPSTLVDFGGGTGGGYALFQTPDDVSRVRTRYPAALRARGWAESGDAYTKSGRRVRVAIDSAHPGARLRVDY